MYIEKIKLENFRNYNKEEIKFNKKINIIYGDNAQGKTNILEAIFLLCLGKSFRTNIDKELIKFEKEKAIVEAEYKKKDRKGKIKTEIENKKNFFINEIKAKKISEILGNIYIVLFSPNDINILKNDPSSRRRFLNIMISQLKPTYLYNLNQYNKILEQRNNYLKQIKYEKKEKENLIIWDEQLNKYAEKIYNYRKEFIEKINSKIKDIHYNITKEEIKIKYKTDYETKEKFIKKLEKNKNIDIEKGYTTEGIQRDDFEILIDGKNISKYGSQGQQRTAIISLKLAEAEIIYNEVEEYPIILLDDFMSELDEKRVKKFIKYIKENQVIITCTEKIKIDNEEKKYFKIENATIKEI